MQRAENIFEPREKNRRPPQRPVRAPRPRASVPGAQPGRRLRQLEDENGKLKRLLAESVLDNAILKDLLGKV